MANKTEKQPAAAPVIFVDQAFKQRTVILPDGRSFAVAKGRIEATDPDLIAYLDSNPEFRREA